MSSWAISGVDLHLDAETSLGRRAGLEAALRSAVRDGRLAAGTRLPSTRSLAAELGFARGTVTAAYDQLVAEGYLAARRGAGTVVADLAHSPTGQVADPPGRGASPPAPVGVPAGVLPAPSYRYDLIPGRPDVAAFPVDAWLRAARRVLPAAPADDFANGDPRGHPELRLRLAEYLGRVRGVRADPESIVVTAGFMQGLGLLAEVLHRRGTETIAVEELTAPFHHEAVRRRGPAVAPLTVDEHGARCEPPEDAGAVLLTPAHQAGYGVVLAPERRRAFVNWARSTGGLLLEDDYDGEFRYGRQPVGALQAMAPEHVAYLGTASKTLAPGLRLGWMVLPRRLVAAVTEAKFYADIQADAIGQLVLAELIRGLDYDRHVRAQRQRYRRRRDLLLRRLASEAPGVRAWGAAAGVQLLLELPPGGPTEEDVLRYARGRGVRVVALSSMWRWPGPPPLTGIAVGYGTPPEHAVAGAVEALVGALRDAFAGRTPGTAESSA